MVRTVFSHGRLASPNVFNVYYLWRGSIWTEESDDSVDVDVGQKPRVDGTIYSSKHHIDIDQEMGRARSVRQVILGLGITAQAKNVILNPWPA
jgi:hypothetical protein